MTSRSTWCNVFLFVASATAVTRKLRKPKYQSTWLRRKNLDSDSCMHDILALPGIVKPYGHRSKPYAHGEHPRKEHDSLNNSDVHRAPLGYIIIGCDSETCVCTYLCVYKYIHHVYSCISKGSEWDFLRFRCFPQKKFGHLQLCQGDDAWVATWLVKLAPKNFTESCDAEPFSSPGSFNVSLSLQDFHVFSMPASLLCWSIFLGSILWWFHTICKAMYIDIDKHKHTHIFLYLYL